MRPVLSIFHDLRPGNGFGVRQALHPLFIVSVLHLGVIDLVVLDLQLLVPQFDLLLPAALRC